MRARETDWDPGSYASFRGLRLRPALDLILQVPDLPPGDVVDLGCGDGAVAGPLRQAFGGRRILGVDASPAMLARAAAIPGGYDDTRLADLAAWEPDERPALLFSNAALHWLPDHGALLPRLAGLLAPGGVLAAQMPRNFDAPSHRLLRDLALGAFPDRFDASDHVPPVAPPAAYHRLLAPLGEVDVWEAEYLQVLAPAAGGQAGGHPVRRFTESTAMRPFAARLSEGEFAEFVAAYDDALAVAYPREADGTVLFPFRRLFLVLVRPAGRA